MKIVYLMFSGFDFMGAFETVEQAMEKVPLAEGRWWQPETDGVYRECYRRQDTGKEDQGLREILTYEVGKTIWEYTDGHRT